MDYPKDFPAESRAAIAAEKIRAGKDFDLVRKHLSRNADIEVHAKKYILRQFIACVREASKLGKRGIWPVDRVEAFALEFLRLSVIDAVYGKCLGFGEHWTSHLSGQLAFEILREFEEYPEWHQYQDMLLQVAEAQAAGTPSAEAKDVTETKRRRSFRPEVDAWMERERLRTVDEAAQFLRIDASALKSIRSSRGRLRCGQETLNRVLKTIGYKDE